MKASAAELWRCQRSPVEQIPQKARLTMHVQINICYNYLPLEPCALEGRAVAGLGDRDFTPDAAATPARGVDPPDLRPSLRRDSPRGDVGRDPARLPAPVAGGVTAPPTRGLDPPTDPLTDPLGDPLIDTPGDPPGDTPRDPSWGSGDAERDTRRLAATPAAAPLAAAGSGSASWIPTESRDPGRDPRRDPGREPGGVLLRASGRPELLGRQRPSECSERARSERAISEGVRSNAGWSDGARSDCARSDCARSDCARSEPRGVLDSFLGACSTSIANSLCQTGGEPSSSSSEEPAVLKWIGELWEGCLTKCQTKQAFHSLASTVRRAISWLRAVLRFGFLDSSFSG